MRLLYVLLYCWCYAGVALAQNTNMLSVSSDPEPETATHEADLRILSWNIYMLETRHFIFTAQQQRAALIVAMLEKENYDVIVFQEAFNPKSRDIISEGLRDKYPYQIGPANNQQTCLKTNSGVWILSKTPLKFIGEIQFADCAGWDCMANKGAIMVESAKNGNAFQIVGTHLQASQGKKNEQIRVKQYQQLTNELLLSNQREDVPQFLCGDFNTLKKSQRYVPMLEILNASDGPFSGSITSSYATDDYRNSDSQEEGEVLDYVLYREKRKLKKQQAQITRQVRRFKTPWVFRGKKRKDLSDHYAVEAIINW
ncbi:MAG: sphingomyelin phosphodiesterase [Chitinophagales bacterium]|jgi:sphingomyelin phosphodiesterase|nr:sphingomyelin phosphodiesterase [Chitinophagales bacterium]